MRESGHWVGVGSAAVGGLALCALAILVAPDLMPLVLLLAGVACLTVAAVGVLFRP